MTDANPFIIKRNDTLPSLSISIKSRGNINQIIPFDLTTVSAVTFSMSDQSGNLKISSSSAEIVSASAGTIQYNWISENTDTEGNFDGEFELFFNGGKKMSIPTLGAIKINICKDINGS